MKERIGDKNKKEAGREAKEKKLNARELIKNTIIKNKKKKIKLKMKEKISRVRKETITNHQISNKNKRIKYSKVNRSQV